MARYLVDVGGHGGWVILPREGAYAVRVLDCSEKMSKKGRPMLELRLGIPTDGGEYKFRDWVHFTDKSMWKVGQLMRAFGMATDKDVDVDPNFFIGKTCRATIRHEVRGEHRNLRIEDWGSDTPRKKPSVRVSVTGKVPF